LDKSSNTFTVLFATIVCVVLAAGLAATYNGLKAKMDANAVFDKQRNVLIAMGLYEPGSGQTQAELEKLFADKVERLVLEVERAEVKVRVREAGVEQERAVQRVVGLERVEGKSAAELDALLKEEAAKPKSQRRYVEIFRGTDADGQPVWSIPISGYGLWSTLYGFLALESDLNTVRGITFYKHGETPGLGGEVDNPAWKRQWRGKHILDEKGELVGVRVKKGAVEERNEFEAAHMVDGLSGATITGNGVSRFVLEDLELYEPAFAELRSS
jgi:Na+-transporting NADH:ubiquinone oxidoreductase subunit C